MAINKQTHIIHKKVLERGGYKSIDMREGIVPVKKPSNTSLLTYIPHGIDSNKFRPLNDADPDWSEFLQFKDVFKNKHGESNFIIFWNNRNIRRKQPGDVILAFKMFCDMLPEEKAKKIILLLHTHPRDPNGTDLIAVKDTICPMYNIVFSIDRIPPKVLNFYYNIADVTLNIASNEGFGLSSAESIMAGTPVINNVTGGLQDQVGFLDNSGEEYFPDENYPTNHTGRLREHGPWAYPVFPSNRSLQGSLETPYIFDDRCQPSHVAVGLLYWYNMPLEDRIKYGAIGRDWLINTAKMESKLMASSMADAIEICIKTFQPKPKAELHKVSNDQLLNSNVGITK